MVLLNEREDRGGKVVFLGQFDAVFDVAGDDQERDVGREIDMAIFAAGLVLDEVFGLIDFPGVVVIRGDAAEQGVGANRLSGGLGNHADLQAVVVSSRGFHRQPSQQRLAWVGQFQQGHARGDLECFFDERQNAQHDKSDGEPRCPGEETVLLDVVPRIKRDQPGAAVTAAIASAVAPPTSISLLRVRMSSSRKQAVITPTQMTMKNATP